MNFIKKIKNWFNKDKKDNVRVPIDIIKTPMYRNIIGYVPIDHGGKITPPPKSI